MSANIERFEETAREILERIQNDAERIYRLERALEDAITQVEYLMGDDAEGNESVEWLKQALRNVDDGFDGYEREEI